MSSHTAHSEPFETIISGSEMFACSDDMARVVTGGAALIRCGSSDAEIRRQLTVEFGEDLVPSMDLVRAIRNMFGNEVIPGVGGADR